MPLFLLCSVLGLIKIASKRWKKATFCVLQREHKKKITLGMLLMKPHEMQPQRSDSLLLC